MRSPLFAVAAILAALTHGAAGDNDFYYKQSVDQFLDSCSTEDNLCLAPISPRIHSEGLRFCLPDDEARAGNEILHWLRANQNATAQNGTRFGSEYLARGIRSAMGNLYGEKGTACPWPDTGSGSGGDDDDFPL